MKPKTLLNTVSKPEAVSAPALEQNEINFDFDTKSELFITSDEIIKILGISSVTFSKWLTTGKFSGVRMLSHKKGDTYRFLKEDFKNWINKSMISA